jgi:O-acetylhomoserine/O-acetylserine sulfhydrylase-like pyridoxal-dependent enzyme
LAEGIYTITVPITTAGLIFDAKDHEKKVYIIGNEGPVVNIVLHPGEYVIFKRITFLHSGVNILARFIENAANDPKYCDKPSK